MSHAAKPGGHIEIQQETPVVLLSIEKQQMQYSTVHVQLSLSIGLAVLIQHEQQ